MRAAYSVRLIFLGLITLIIFGEDRFHELYFKCDGS